MKLAVNRMAVVATSMALAAITTLGCSKGSPTAPTGRGVNITVDAKALSSAELGMVTVGSLIVTGDELQVQQFNVVPQISSGQLTFQYLPKTSTATTAMLSFQFDALGDTGLVYGTGKAGPVTLAAGAVSVTITLSKSPGTSIGLGATCTTDTDCGTGFCTDHVCCQEACKEPCASCAATHTKGLCTAYPANTDPDGECSGFSMASGTGGTGGKGGAGAAGGAAGGKADAAVPMDASASDAEPINAPDGGIMATASTCGGTCNGMKACAFASPGTSCGKPFCNTRKDSGEPRLRRQGELRGRPAELHERLRLRLSGQGLPHQLQRQPRLSGRLLLQRKHERLRCHQGRRADLRNRRRVHEYSLRRGQRNGRLLQHRLQLAQQLQQHRLRPASASASGVTCTAGVACQILYADSDVDGYGDRTGSLTAGTAKAGCAGTPPTGFVADNSDCDDKDANVHPGQTGYFGTVSKGTGTFDYDCDGTLDQGVPGVPERQLHVLPVVLGRLRNRSDQLQLLGSAGVVGVPPRGWHLPFHDSSRPRARS